MQSYPQDHLAKECWISSNNPFVRQTIYNFVDEYGGNFLTEFDFVKETYEFNVKRYGKSTVFGDHFRRYNENRMVQHSLILIESAHAMHESNTAIEIQKRALELLDDTRLKDALT